MNLPMIFKVKSESQSGIQTVWTSTNSEGLEIQGAIPPEFSGPGGGASPEDLYALALSNCFLATLKVFAEKSKLHFNNIHISSELTISHNEHKTPWMSVLSLTIYLDGVQDVERMRRLVSKTTRQCMIINSVKTKVLFYLTINSEKEIPELIV